MFVNAPIILSGPRFHAAVCLLVFILIFIGLAYWRLLAAVRAKAHAKEVAFAARVQPVPDAAAQPETLAERFARGDGLDEAIAARVHQHANRDYYLLLLRSLEAALKLEGYVLSVTPGPGMSAMLLPEVQERVARAICVAKLTSYAPRIDRAALDRTVTRDLEEGNGEIWLNTLVGGLASAGIFLAPRTPGDFFGPR